MLIRLLKLLLKFATPHEHLPGYMERYWLLRPRRWLPLGLRLHHILASDNDRLLHDHPWPFISLVLAGEYEEVCPLEQWQPPLLDTSPTYQRVITRTPGSVVLRPRRWRHRIALGEGTCWTLVLTIGRPRAWGFYTPAGWVDREIYLGPGVDT